MTKCNRYKVTINHLLVPTYQSLKWLNGINAPVLNCVITFMPEVCLHANSAQEIDSGTQGFLFPSFVFFFFPLNLHFWLFLFRLRSVSIMAKPTLQSLLRLVISV